MGPPPLLSRRCLKAILFHFLIIPIFGYLKNDKNASNNTEVPYLLTDIEMKCPEGWENEGTKCYKLYQSERSWPQALIFCGRYGATLAKIESQKENTFLSQILTRPQRASSTWTHSSQWIGLVSQKGSSDDPLFIWSDGSAVSRYAGFWATNQPDYSTGSCTSTSLGRHSELEWGLKMCNLLLPFFCELPACISGSFFCQNGKCVPESVHCNGINECGDFSDELNCPVAHSNENCMKYERGESGQIETPSYPSSYRANSNCRWVIEGPVNSRITLSFDVFETEENQDFVTILDGGPAENSTIVLETLSGTPKSSQLTVTSSTNMLTVRFRSDSSIQARGFKATWRANSFTCGGMLLNAQSFGQSFSSPKPYPAGGECVWRIEAPQGQIISLSVDTFDIDENKDFLMIYDGFQPSAPILAKLTGKIENQLIISTQNHLYLYFYSNYANSAKGFTLSYKKGCDNTIHYTHGNLLSPGNSLVPYPNSQRCKYIIDLPESKQGQPITLAVNEFDVLAGDYLKIYEDEKLETPLHETQGFNELQRPPKHIYAKQGKAVLVFDTNALKSGRGWNLTFSTNCPVLKSPQSVYLSTQNTAFGTKVSVTCKTGYEFSRMKFSSGVANGIGQRFDVTCELGGKWSVDTIPHCQQRMCSAVPQIANGLAISATNVSFGGIVKYKCNDGFSFISGKEVEEIMCKEDGWSRTPKCISDVCPALPQFLNGKRVLRFGDGNGFGTVYEFKCDTGYRQTGASTILCRPDGRWSSEQPSCKKLICPNIPQVKNGRIIVTGGRLEFGDAARVECSHGYRSTGAEIIHCLANQTLSHVPECRDLNECAEELATCSGKSTECVNLDGGYTCQCLNGFRPQLSCPSFLPLIPIKVETSSSRIANLSNLAYCADSTDSQRVIVFTFAAPKILERIRFEKINKGMPEVISIEYANDTNGHFVSNANLSNVEMKNLDMAGSQVVVLHDPVEAQMLRITIEEFKQSPCAKIELLGCQKSSCLDQNECEVDNGYCDHLCHNAQGSYSCSCTEGYDLFKMDGQQGIFLKEGETGYNNLDSVRFNKTCVPRRCAQLTPPENGKIISPVNDFQYPKVVEFQCKFGYQLHGSRFLKCGQDEKWNGTVPTCSPAVCEGIQNNTAIGMFVVGSRLPFISYGDNVTIVCTQQNRPARSSPLGGIRQCIYDPHPNGPDYRMSGTPADCPLVDCGPPPSLSGAFYEGNEKNFKVGSSFGFSCRPPYSVVGKSSYDDRIVRCNVDGTWDLGTLRWSPDEGRTYLESVEEGAIAKFKCNRPGYKPFPRDALNCTLGTPCLLSEDVGISSGFIPDGAFSDSDTKVIYGYEPHKARMSSTGWCGSKDAFIFLSVDLQRIYTVTTLRLAGVGGSGYLRGHVTKLQLFHKLQFSQNYDSYPIEFESAPGNHNKIYQFDLHPPVRARYVLLGVTEYETNPCLRFDLQGCLAPLSLAHEIPRHLQVGWNSSVPQCIDAEPPVFKNCPANPIFAQTDESGQLLPVNFDIPIATDNAGVAYVRVEPKDFKPPYPIHEPLSVKYIAFDDAGNSAECVVELRVPDNQPPAMKCPESYILPTKRNETERRVYFNESSVAVVIHDASNVTELKIQPSEAVLRLNTHIDVEATATDSHGNQNSCKFQVALMPEPCSDWALSVDENTVIRSCSKKPKGNVCSVRCREGYRLVNSTVSEQTELRYTCTGQNEWAPDANPPACVAIAQEPARYELHVNVDYIASVVPGNECMKPYIQTVTSYFDSIGQLLTQRCSVTMEVFVRVLNVEFHGDPENPLHVRANYTIQILPTVLQDVFYELCSLTLRTIFDLRIPGATIPIKQLLSIPSGILSAPTCPAMNATETSITQGFSCSDGEILKMNAADKGELPECIPCAKGTAFVQNTCIPCPEGSYQNKEGQSECKACPDGTFTNSQGAQSKSQCLSVCGNGMFSLNGLIPCALCPRNTFSGPSNVDGGSRECEPCPDNTFTANLGATGPSQCKKPCKSGYFSATGLEPCSPCPINFYQPNPGQQKCSECPKDSITHELGRSLEIECKALDCTGVKCQNRGTCAVENHQVVCQCKPGYRGKFCEETVPLCDNHPCQNNGTCELFMGSFRCICPQNYTGPRCQFGPDECIGVNCPNGGVCQDLPGIGTTKCLCRPGWASPDCSQVADPCQNTPCKNGADCVPLQLGRYKCRCLPGWEGANCEVNTDDCKNNPCAMGAVCHDLINDFECECPHGFSGKRCHIKEDLCTPNPCLNGTCIDTLFNRKCRCNAGWTGQFCEQNIDDCAPNPCKNGGVCKDQETGFICQCPSGFHGTNCQYMVDHCASRPCQNNATCVNQGANYKCECPLGFEGIQCEINRNECDTTHFPCNAEGTDVCDDLVNGFKCQCRPGYTGEKCETHIDQCASEPCQHNGICIDLGPSFKCNCSLGWKGERCEQESGKCEEKPCQNGGSCIQLGNGDYFCVCSEGVSGKNCENAPNRCIGEPCINGGVCGDFGSRMECNCPKGFVGEGCQYELDACHSNVCKNGASCVQEKDGSYRCICAPGYTGTDCETEINECSPSPCPMSATCIDQINGYYCRCPFNMTGTSCDKKIDPDYDLRFNDGLVAAKVGLAVPFHFASGAFSLSLWVRFDEAHSKGSVLTLYSSQASNLPSNLTELLRVSADSVRLALFSGDTPLTLHFPSSQKLNDGNWNNLIITWTAHEGSYSLIWNAVRLYSDHGYGKNKQLDISAWISLGQPVDGLETESKFVGSLTRVNMWSRILDFESDIPSIVQKCQDAPILYNGLVLHFANYDRLNGNVEKIVRSTCGRSQSTGLQHVTTTREERAADAVKVEQCPNDIFIVTPLKEMNVTWSEPIFSSANSIDRVEKNLKPGQVFTSGEFMVLYAAYDNESNIAECSFKIHISREFCPDIPNPPHGISNCDHWGPDLKYRACSIQCEDGYEFSEQPAIFYTCGSDGKWRPNAENAVSFRYPQCSKKSPAERLIHIKVHYPTVTICNQASRTVLSDRLLQRIHQLNHKWRLCSEANSEDLCSGAKVTVNCISEDENSILSKRHKREQQVFSVHVDIPVKRANEMKLFEGKQMDPMEIIQTEVLLNEFLNLETVLPNGRPDLTSFKIQNEFKCKEGEVNVRGEMCVPCGAGSFFNTKTQQCEQCRSGTYQPSQGQSSCLVCAQNGVTTSPGAISVDECKPRCDVGHFLNLVNGQCEACGYGFYQPQDGMFMCIPCGIGKTTLEKTATSEAACRDECEDGEHLTSSGNCQPCSLGFYRAKGVHKQCTECPSGTTTEKTKAVKRSECNTPKCVPGQFLVISNKQCQFCPRGTYQDEPLQTTCRACPTDHTTSSAGATHESQCYSTNQCSTGEDNCSWHAICIDLPDDNDVPSFQCKCKPGYRGNGTHCTDACNNYCLNDGVCKKNQIGFVECACKENFSGERCEIRFQPRTQKIAFITAGIGGIVVLLIVIIIVIWMIGYRYNRTDRISSLVDKPGLSNFDSPLQSNFLYGRNGVERSASSLGQRGSGSRPVGFYYEDETPYESSEVKTMFVGGGGNSEEETAESSGVEDSQRSETANLHQPPKPSTRTRDSTSIDQRPQPTRRIIYQSKFT